MLSGTLSGMIFFTLMCLLLNLGYRRSLAFTSNLPSSAVVIVLTAMFAFGTAEDDVTAQYDRHHLTNSQIKSAVDYLSDGFILLLDNEKHMPHGSSLNAHKNGSFTGFQP